MERTMISWNVPNLVTINLMAWLGFMIFALVFQAIPMKRGSGGGIPSPGADDINSVGGY